MRSILAALALALFLAAMADKADAQQTARHPNGDTATVTDEPCKLASVPEQFRSQLRAGHAVVSGTRYSFCWVSRGTYAQLIYEDGDGGVIPWSEFEKANKKGV